MASLHRPFENSGLAVGCFCHKGKPDQLLAVKVPQLGNLSRPSQGIYVFCPGSGSPISRGPRRASNPSLEVLGPNRYESALYGTIALQWSHAQRTEHWARRTVRYLTDRDST